MAIANEIQAARSGPAEKEAASVSGVPLGERLAATPRLVRKALVKALGAGDLDAAAACFVPDACLVVPDGTAVHDGRRSVPASPTLVLRRLRDEWKLAIAAPWGLAPPLEAVL